MEVSSTGLHGANRLASNSLLEGLVFGARAGEHAAEAARQADDDYRALPIRSKRSSKQKEQLDIADIRNSVQSAMWRLVGVQRDEAQLKEAIQALRGYTRYVLPHVFESEEGWELQNLVTVAHLMAQSALARHESRGVHFRKDFPEVDDSKWRKHLTYRFESVS